MTLHRFDLFIAAVVADDVAFLEHPDVLRRFPFVPVGDVRFVGLLGLFDESLRFRNFLLSLFEPCVIRVCHWLRQCFSGIGDWSRGNTGGASGTLMKREVQTRAFQCRFDLPDQHGTTFGERFGFGQIPLGQFDFGIVIDELILRSPQRRAVQQAAGQFILITGLAQQADALVQVLLGLLE